MDTSPRPENTSAQRAGGVDRIDLDVDPAVATFLAAVRDEYREPLPSDVTSRHLRMILAEAAVSPAPPALRDRWARHARRIAAIGAVKIALTATAAAAATGAGLAATGSLPDAAQTAVAGIAEQVGLTLPVPAADTPGSRTMNDQPMPGIGEGGVPSITEGSDLPGNTSDAPGLDRGDDGLPEPATDRGAGAPADDERSDTGNTGGEERGTDRAEEAPAPAEAPASQERTEDTPAADRPAAPAEDAGAEAPADPPADPPADEAGQTDEAGDDEAGDDQAADDGERRRATAQD